MATPVIGITCGRERAQSGVWDCEAVFLQWAYGQALVTAGAALVVLPPQPALPDAVEAVLDGLDGLVLPGGADIDPALYGESANPENDAPRPQRDAWELALVDAATRRGVPFLGICRGAQVLNVARGGTLIQHLPDVVGNREHEGDGDTFGSVSVTTVPHTHIARLHPGTSHAPVYHHQAIGTVGEGLIVAARSEYGVIEAVEDPRSEFCLAVQWHPEQDSRQELFHALVAAGREFRAARA